MRNLLYTILLFPGLLQLDWIVQGGQEECRMGQFSQGDQHFFNLNTLEDPKVLSSF